jgi:hypothetical protein
MVGLSFLRFGAGGLVKEEEEEEEEVAADNGVEVAVVEDGFDDREAEEGGLRDAIRVWVCALAADTVGGGGLHEWVEGFRWLIAKCIIVQCQILIYSRKYGGKRETRGKAEDERKTERAVASLADDLVSLHRKRSSLIHVPLTSSWARVHQIPRRHPLVDAALDLTSSFEARLWRSRSTSWRY